MVCAQLVAIGRISHCREEDRRRMRLKEILAASQRPMLNGESRHIVGTRDPPNGDGKYVNGGEYYNKLSGVSEESYFD